MLKHIFIFILFTIFIVSENVEATSLRVLWQSPVISGEGMNADICDIQGDGIQDLIVAEGNQIIVREAFGSSKVLLQKKILGVDHFHRVSCGNWEGNGYKQILAVGSIRGEFITYLLEFDGTKIRKKKSWNKVVLAWKDNRIASQETRGRGAWSHYVEIDSWSGKKLKTEKRYKITSGIGPLSKSLFHLKPYPDIDNQFLYLKNNGKLSLMDQNGKILNQSSMKYGGYVDSMSLSLKDPLGIQKNFEISLHPRFDVSLDNKIIIGKNEGTFLSKIGKVNQVKYSQLFLLKHADAGFEEDFQSQRFNEAIADVQWVDFDQDGFKNEILVVFVRDQFGKMEYRVRVFGTWKNLALIDHKKF